MRADLARKLLEVQDTVFRRYYEAKWGNSDGGMGQANTAGQTYGWDVYMVVGRECSLGDGVKFLEGKVHTHTHSGWAGVFIFMIYFYILLYRIDDISYAYISITIFYVYLYFVDIMRLIIIFRVYFIFIYIWFQGRWDSKFPKRKFKRQIAQLYFSLLYSR